MSRTSTMLAAALLCRPARWPLVGVALALCLSGCVVTRHAQARDGAARATCQRMERCGWVGQGKKYPTPEACLEDVRVFWGRRWDVQNCDRRIDPEAYSVCLTSIEVTDCGNVLEALNTALNKCAESRVCAGPRPR